MLWGKEACMENDKFEVSEEIEILIAKRLLGEISKDENLKLELFLQENPAVKKSYFEKEGVKRLLVNAADNLEELQLPTEKRNIVLNKVASKSAGKFILYTYSAAALVFFSFMIGIYFYANKKLQDPETTVAYELKDSPKLDTSDESDKKLLQPTKEIITIKEEMKQEDIAEGKESEEPKKLSDGKKSKDSLAKSKGSGAPQGEYGALQDLEKHLLDDSNEVKKKMPMEKMGESKKQDKIIAGSVPAKEETIEYAKSEKKITAPRAATSKALKEESKPSDAKKADIPESEEVHNEAKSANVRKEEGSKLKEVAKYKEADGSHQKDKTAHGGAGALERSDSKQNGKTSNPVAEPVTNKMEIVAASQSSRYEYKVGFSFNQTSYNIQFASTTDLSNEDNAKKLTLRQFLEFSEDKSKEDSQKSALASSPISISKFESIIQNETQKEPNEPAKPGEVKSESVISTEIALLHTIYQQYQKRNSLTQEAKKKFLDELKKSLNHLTYFKQDPDLKIWLANIEKELK